LSNEVIKSGTGRVFLLHTCYTSVFQPFCCSGTLNKREDHSQNPMRPAMYER